MICKNCGTYFVGKFCPQCGTAAETDKFCSACGTKNAPTAKFCMNCGASLGTVEPILSSPVGSAPVNYTKPVTYAQPVTYTQPVQQTQPVESGSNGCAIAGFVLSFFGITWLIAFILSIVGIAKAKSYGGKGKGLGIAGLIITILWVVLIVVMWFVLLPLIIDMLPEFGFDFNF